MGYWCAVGVGVGGLCVCAWKLSGTILFVSRLPGRSWTMGLGLLGTAGDTAWSGKRAGRMLSVGSDVVVVFASVF